MMFYPIAIIKSKRSEVIIENVDQFIEILQKFGRCSKLILCQGHPEPKVRL